MDKNSIYQIILSFYYSKILFPKLEDFYHQSQELRGGLNLKDLFQPSENSADSVLWAQILKDQDKIEEQILRAKEKGIQFTYPGAWDFPQSMFNMADVPFFLTYLGHPVWLQRQGLAVVGSRDPGYLSERWCEEELPMVLNETQLIFISGGARGVDQMAHRICLRHSVPTVAFLPAGLLEIYPSDFSSWVDVIANCGGALVSEFSPQVKMKKYFFQRRNRLIAGLSIGTLVIEARKKSGTLITARQTLEQGKPLFVLPSHPLDIGNQGGLDLLCDGAAPVRDAKDLTICLQSEILRSNFQKTDLVQNAESHH